jgi:hypothetical protein
MRKAMDDHGQSGEECHKLWMGTESWANQKNALQGKEKGHDPMGGMG